MLCPSCGFISFDQINTCVKCSGDLSELSGQLRGTATQQETQFFLGSVVTLDEAGSAAAQAGTQDMDTSPHAEDAGGSDVGLSESYTDEDAAMILEEETEELDVELGDISSLDLSEIDKVEDESAPAIDLQPEVKIGGAEEFDLSMEDTEEADLDLNLDAMEEESVQPALSDEEQPVSEAEESEEGQAEHLKTDLEKIDLSDLVPPGKGKKAEPSGSADTEDEGPDLDLSEDSDAEGTIEFSFDDETAGAPADELEGVDLDFSGLEDSGGDLELEPIDLSLDDDDGVLDLSLDSDGDEEKKE